MWGQVLTLGRGGTSAQTSPAAGCRAQFAGRRCQVPAFCLGAHATKTRRKVQECSFSDSRSLPNPPSRKAPPIEGGQKRKGGDMRRQDRGRETEKITVNFVARTGAMGNFMPF